jgi:hypothetical protein
VPSLPPGLEVTGTLQSTLLNLPTVTTDSSGAARFSVTIPVDFEVPGNHVLTVRSSASGTVLRTVRFGVDTAGRIVPAADGGPAVAAGTLARTGFPSWTPFGIALAVSLVVCGALLHHRSPVGAATRADRRISRWRSSPWT